MLETLAVFVEILTSNERLFYFTMTFLFIQGLFLIYLFLALFIHRKDRKELVSIAISVKIDVLFRYSWKGVELEIRHPTAHFRRPRKLIRV